MLNKKALSEADIRTKFILPAVLKAGWDVMGDVREEVAINAGTVVVRGRHVERDKILFADYVLFWKGEHVLAVVEAKDNNHAVAAGLEQAEQYAEHLDAPFAFSSNGDGFAMLDRTGLGDVVQRSLALDAFPSPQTLWARYRAWRDLPPAADALVEQPLHASGREVRYYQAAAINRVIEAVARGRRRALLVMATGTGKTWTAFQIAWRLKQAGRARRILFLADRDALASQAMRGDFNPFGAAMTRIESGKADPSYEVFFALYQSILDSDDDAKSLYRKFTPGFFDLVIVDECHRGSAEDDAAWRRVLDYFSGAVQLGLTATPHESRHGSNAAYFGDPVYTYSLRQGIADGYLAPFKVIRVDLDVDLQGWRPTPGQRDDLAKLIDQRDYGRPDFDRLLVLTERTRRVAERVVELLRDSDRHAKTIVFCQDIDHATRMVAALRNAAPEWWKESPEYFARVTSGVPNVAGLVDRLCDPDAPYPVVAVTSELLSTGVDVKTCRYVVLDQVIESMTKFKQIVGRGTRLLPSHGKLYFTILDFRNVTRLFADPKFDGPPISVYEPGAGQPVVPPDERPDDEAPGRAPLPPPGAGRIVVGRAQSADKFVVTGAPVSVVAEHALEYVDGRPRTVALLAEAGAAVRKRYPTLDALTDAWRAAPRRQDIVDELRTDGVLLPALQEPYSAPVDPLDLLAVAAFDAPAGPRAWRAAQARVTGFLAKHPPAVRPVLEALLDLYEREGPLALEDPGVLRLPAMQGFGTLVEITRRFGGREAYRAALGDVFEALYRARPGSS